MITGIIIALFVLGVANMTMCLTLVWNIRKTRKDIERLSLLIQICADQQRMICGHSIFTNDAMELLLWKNRQEVYTWMQLWAQMEQYEAADQAKTVVQQMEAMINYHRNKTNENEKSDNK